MNKAKNTSDNTSAFRSDGYDEKVRATIPFYDQFYSSIIDLIQCATISPDRWLDTGCGTGTLGVEAGNVFPETYFVMADPSEGMLDIAQEKIGANDHFSFVAAASQDLPFPTASFDVVTAVQCHHYSDKEGRFQAVQNCFRMLKKGGIFITFENILPRTTQGIEIGLNRWKNFQIKNGRTDIEAQKHLDRFNKEFFPITVTDHLRLYEKAGFENVEILWLSYMQAGFYAVK